MKGKRFIAGAICPKCAVIDHMFVHKDENGQILECLDCGYREKMSEAGEAQELPTRVNHINKIHKNNKLNEKKTNTEKVNILGFVNKKDINTDT